MVSIPANADWLDVCGDSKLWPRITLRDELPYDVENVAERTALPHTVRTNVKAFLATLRDCSLIRLLALSDILG